MKAPVFLPRECVLSFSDAFPTVGHTKKSKVGDYYDTLLKVTFSILTHFSKFAAAPDAVADRNQP